MSYQQMCSSSPGLQNLPTFSGSLTWHQFDEVVCLCYQEQELAEATQLTAEHHHYSVTYRSCLAGLCHQQQTVCCCACVFLLCVCDIESRKNYDQTWMSRLCQVPLAGLSWSQVWPLLQPWRAAGTLEHTCQRAVEVHLQHAPGWVQHLAVWPALFSRDRLRVTPESEGR